MTKSEKSKLRTLIRNLKGQEVQTVWGPSVVGDIIKDNGTEYIEMYEFGEEYYVIKLENWNASLQ